MSTAMLGNDVRKQFDRARRLPGLRIRSRAGYSHWYREYGACARF